MLSKHMINAKIDVSWWIWEICSVVSFSCDWW